MPWTEDTMAGAQDERPFTPPLGTGDTEDYDGAIRRWTRELRCRGAMLDLLAPRPGEAIVDVGCGTGSFAILLKKRHPQSLVAGIDPDAEALGIARQGEPRGSRYRLAAGFRRRASGGERGRGDFEPRFPSGAARRKAQRDGRDAPRAEAGRAARPRRLWPPGGIDAPLFRLTVQRLDGIGDTQPNADGVLPGLIAEAGFADVEERDRIHTVTGTIAILTARKR